MKKASKIFLSILLLIFFTTTFQACKKTKEPSILKVYVRSLNNELLSDARVVIVADINSNPPSAAYVDTVFTNNSGYAEIPMEDFFALSNEKVGFFDVYVSYGSLLGIEDVRVKKNITAVKTVYVK
jgi:hypothetical protein